jgi:hypothetical protein
MLKQFIWQEVLSGFNEEVIISNKPTALYKALNADMEKQPGSLRKRKGYKLFGSQIVDNNDILGLFDFVKSDGSRVPLTVINDTVAITNASYSDPDVTLTVASGHGIVAGDTIVVSGLEPSGYNGTFTVASVTATEIVYSKTGLGALTTTTGTATFSKIMYYDSGWTLSKKGFTPSVDGRFETFVDYCFFTNGQELKTSSDGQTWSTTNLLNTVDISAVAYSDPTVTLTVPAGHGVVVGDSITVSGLVPSGYNGTFTVTAVDTTTISYSSAGLGTSQTVAITNASYSDPEVTLTVASGHGIVVGNEITVSGLAPSEYNGTFTVTEVDTTTIKYEVAGAGALSTTTGSILVTIDADLTVQFSLPANDVLAYGNYLFLVGIEGYRSDILWSNVPSKNDSGDYVIDWNRNNNVSVNLGNGEELIAGQKYRGALYLFKNSSISRTITPVASNGIKDLSNNIGANSKDCIQVVSGQMVFFNDGKRNSKKGFYSFNSLADAEPQIISEPVQPYIDGMTAGQTVVAGVINDLYVAYVGAVSNEEHDINITHCYLVFNAKTNRWLGAWSFNEPAKKMALLTISNSTSLYFGDDDGEIWQTNEGNKDGYEDAQTPGSQIVLDVISHPYDLTRGAKGYRESYMKRSLQQLYIAGDRLDNCKLRYRFDKRLSEKGGWETVDGMKNPVHKAPFKRTEAHLFQYRITHTGEQENEPIIRKLIIEHE